MALLYFDKPKKVRSTEEHNKIYSSDSGVDGTYVPNMSDEDAGRWKAKHITGENERIEIRKSLHGAQLVIVVRKNPPIPYPEYPKRVMTKEEYAKYNADTAKWREAMDNIKVSMNGSLWLSFQDYREMEQAIAEACGILNVQAF